MISFTLPSHALSYPKRQLTQSETISRNEIQFFSLKLTKKKINARSTKILNMPPHCKQRSDQVIISCQSDFHLPPPLPFLNNKKGSVESSLTGIRSQDNCQRSRHDSKVLLSLRTLVHFPEETCSLSNLKSVPKGCEKSPVCSMSTCMQLGYHCLPRRGSQKTPRN